MTPGRPRVYSEKEAAERRQRSVNESLARIRAAGRDIEIPKCKHKRRRIACEKDPPRWLRTYLGVVFRNPFTEMHLKIIKDILETAAYGGDKAIAAPRGIGKTTIVEGVITYGILTGRLRFVVIAAASGKLANKIIKHIKQYLERSKPLAEDYPEVTAPILALDGSPTKATRQTVNGERTRMEWKEDQIKFPEVAGSKCSGAVIVAAGMDSAVRGLREWIDRPDFILIDDPETRESCSSAVQTASRKLIIEEDLAGLGAGDKKCGRAMLCTIMRRSDDEGNPTVSFEYTDRQLKPSWDGDRFRFVEVWPTRQDLWDEYQTLRQQSQSTGDKHSRKAHQFYLDRFDIMNDGASLSVPYHFNSAVLPDGSRTEASALQRAYNIISDRGLEHFRTEYNNDPVEAEETVSTKLASFRIQKQVSGFARKVVPPECFCLTQGIDVRKIALHWVARAWRVDEQRQLITGYTIDYGVTEVLGTQPGNDEGLDEALVRALHDRKEQVDQSPYATVDGTPWSVKLTLVDAGWRTDAIYTFCRQAGDTYKPSMGFGKSAGCASPNFHSPVRSNMDKRLGDRWFLSRRPQGVWLVCMDSDHWKNWEHDRWRSDPAKPGALLLFGDASHAHGWMSEDQKRHMSYSKHIVAEQEEEELKDGRLVRKFKSRSDTNHYLDASYMSDVAASMSGVRLLGQKKGGGAVSSPEGWSQWFGEAG